MRLLVVEDDPIIALSYEDEAVDAGASVVDVATSAVEALAVAERERPDLAFVEVRLRGGPMGEEALQSLAALGIRVVVVTGAPQDLPPAGRQACAALLVKPVIFEELTVALRAGASAA